MNNKEKLMAFFEAENSRDWKKYQTFLSSNVKWSLYSKERTVIFGIQNYMRMIRDVYKNSSTTFIIEKLIVNQDQSRIIAILKNTTDERSCEISDFEDGKIINEYEFILFGSTRSIELNP